MKGLTSESLSLGDPTVERQRPFGSRMPVETGHHQWKARPMPTYVYRCDTCGETFERIETMVEHETAKPPCPHCNSKKVTRVPTPFMAITGKKS